MKTLFNTPLAHTNDPVTSHEAADKLVESGELTRQENEVWDVIKKVTDNMKCLQPQHNNFTAKDLAHWSCLDYHLIQRRLSGLLNKGKIERISVNDNSKPPWVKRDNCCVWRVK